MTPTRPKVVVTRRLPEPVETRMRELFDVTLNETDAPMGAEALREALPEDCKIIPGHGDVTDTKELAAYHEMLLGARDLVRRDLRLGLKLEDMLEAGALDRYAERWDWSFIDSKKFLAFLVEEYDEKE